MIIGVQQTCSGIADRIGDHVNDCAAIVSNDESALCLCWEIYPTAAKLRRAALNEGSVSFHSLLVVIPLIPHFLRMSIGEDRMIGECSSSASPVNCRF